MIEIKETCEKTQKLQVIQDKYRGYDEDIVPDVDADLSHWSKMPYWSLEESVALLLGKDPEIVNWDIVQYHLEWPFATDLSLNYEKLRDLVFRAFEKQEIEEKNPPSIFIHWADSRDIEVPKELRKLVEDVTEIKSKMDTETENLLKAKDDEITVLKNRITELKSLAWDGFDESLSTHAKELAVAVKAHAAISKSWKKGISIKKQISIWLQQNYPKLMNEERERISKICNWQKSGGAPSTP
jgi:hypothetical protein